MSGSDNTKTESAQVRATRNYFEYLDTGSDRLGELFDPDFTFYFPKYGVGKGFEDFGACGAGLQNYIAQLQHVRDELKFYEVGNTVVAEGFTYGEDTDGHKWHGGETPGGRFCSVFEFTDGLISRMHIYLDPDYTSRHGDGFLWGKEGRRW